MATNLRSAPGTSWLPAIGLLLCATARAEITVHTDFEGGSAKVVALDQSSRTLRIMPAGNPACGWPCWWYLRVDGLEKGKALTLEVAGSDARLVREGAHYGKLLAASWAQPDRATWSADHKHWR